MLLSRGTGVVTKLPGYKTGTQLQLVKDLSAKAVSLGVAGNRLTTHFQLCHGVVICSLIVNDAFFTAGR